MIGVIADDLTGAAELGALGRRLGLKAEVVFAGEPVGKSDLVCVDTDSRSCSADESAVRAAGAARCLLQGGATWVYKKVDSVLRGQVTAELEAIMQQLGLSLALLIPANPSLGRVIRDGHYFVHERPIDETEFANDPEYPRLSAAVRQLVAEPKTVPLRLGKPGEPLPERGIVVGDAASGLDLQRWAHQRTAEILAAGGVEFFGAILAATLGLGSIPAAQRAAAQERSVEELFVCGTMSQSSREFIKAARLQGTPVFSLPERLAGGGDWEPVQFDRMVAEAAEALSAHARVIVTIGLPPVSDRSVSKRLHQHLATWAQAILRRSAAGQVYAEGGATARELLRQLAWKRMEVVQELAPGIATLAIAEGLAPRVTLKPGSYIWPATIIHPKDPARHE